MVVVYQVWVNFAFCMQEIYSIQCVLLYFRRNLQIAVSVARNQVEVGFNIMLSNNGFKSVC